MKLEFAKLLFVLVFFAIQLNAQSTKSVMLKLPDTGQQNSYTLTFGEDADFSINPPYFITNSAKVVTDTVTGLMWQRADMGEMTYEKALLYADSSSFATYTDWRLPNAMEAYSILNLQTQNPALDLKYFIKTDAEYWWTSDLQANDQSKVWVINAGGGIGNHAKFETISAGGIKKMHLRLVRTNKSKEINSVRYFKSADALVYDSLTNLIWQKTPYTDTLTWEQALQYADTLTQAGYSDWRLPNIKELQSLQDNSVINPALNTNYFNVFGRKKFWSSTTLSNKSNSAWYFDAQFGITTYQVKTSRLNTWVVRGGINSTGLQVDVNYPLILNISPNPCKDVLLINFNAKAKVQTPYLIISNVLGQIIYQSAVSKPNTKINTSEYPNGIFYLTVIDATRKCSMKFVVHQ